MAVAFTQVGFRGRNDDGTLTTATWKAAANTNWTQNADTIFRVRFDSSQTGNTASALTPQLQYNRNGGTWTPVTGSSAVVKAVASANVADAAATTQLISTGTFVAGSFDEVDGLAAATASIAQNGHTEHEFSIKIVGADVANGDTINLRLVRSPSTAYGTYTASPAITVAKAALLQIPNGTVSISGKAPALRTALVIGAATLALVGLAPAVVITQATSETVLTIPTATVVTSGLAPSLRLAVAVPKGAVTITARSVTLKLAVAVPKGAATISGKAPALRMSLAVPKATLALSGKAPALRVSLAVPKAALVITGKAPALALVVAVPKRTVTLTGFAPTVLAGSSTVLQVPKGALVLTGRAPALLVTAHRTLVIPAAAVTITGKAPIIKTTANKWLEVPTAALTLATAAPHLALVVPVGSGALVITGRAPSLINRPAVTPTGTVLITDLLLYRLATTEFQLWTVLTTEVLLDTVVTKETEQ